MPHPVAPINPAMAKILEKALQEARARNYVGKNILGTGVDVEIHVHRGAGSYECGEETALIESLEGKRGQPRIKPPFPAVVGLYGCPTIVNNVETLVNVPLVLTRGADWFAGYGSPKNGGPKLYSISGQPPALWDLPEGCRFAPRCPYVQDRCLRAYPALFRVNGKQAEHTASCWRLESR